MEESRKIRVGITHGDINGVGYEVILKTFADSRMVELCTPIIYGSAKVAAYHRKAMDLPAVNFNIVNSAQEALDGKINLVTCVDDEIKVEFSRPTTSAGEAALNALERATQEYNEGFLDVILTAPINKHTIQSDAFVFPGHTEYFEQVCNQNGRSLMILLNDQLRVALVTGHVALSEVSEMLTPERILQKLQTLNRALKMDFAIRKPRIAVLSLNPHAGDDGLLGKEEQEVIIPAMELAQQKGIMCFGPYAADGFFGSSKYTHFDAVLAMYHDQGLAPFKTIAMESGVNYTAGLSLVRTSPAHGTAYDIAGKNEASEASFREALYAALDIFRTRKMSQEISQNPLRKQYFDRSGDNEKLDLTSEQAAD